MPKLAEQLEKIPTLLAERADSGVEPGFLRLGGRTAPRVS